MEGSETPTAPTEPVFPSSAGGAPTTISYDDYLRLEGLLTLSRYHLRYLNNIEKAAREITGDIDSGHTGDAIWNEYPAVRLCELLNIAVDLPRRGGT